MSEYLDFAIWLEGQILAKKHRPRKRKKPNFKLAILRVIGRSLR